MQPLSEWLKKMSDPLFPFRTLDEGLEIEDGSDCLSETSSESFCDLLDVDPMVGWHRKKYTFEGKKDRNGKPYGKVCITCESGGEFKGFVEDGKREGECVGTWPEQNIRKLQGSYYNDRPEGFVSLEREDGSWREGFCLDGRWDGLVREFDDERMIKFIGRYKDGTPNGVCWLRLKAECYLVGTMDAEFKMNSENGIFLYPDLSTAYSGSFKDGEMINGRACTVDAWKMEGNIMQLQVTKIWGPDRSLREATTESLSSHPLLGDPYEDQWIVCKESNVAGGGEGLFAKRDIPSGMLVALYNGLKQPPLAAEEKPDDWEMCGYSIGYYESTTAERGWGDLDIPPAFRSLNSYCATLAHKMNHSFQNNCSFSDIVHPIYGYIPCTITTKDVRAGDELFVHYHYCLNDCPAWYEELYNNL